MVNPHLRHRMSNIERQMDTYGSGSAGDTPIQSGGAYGEFGSPPQQERLYTERSPFTTPYQPDFSVNEFLKDKTHYGPEKEWQQQNTEYWNYPGTDVDQVTPMQHYSPWSFGGPAGGPHVGAGGASGGQMGISHSEYPDYMKDFWHNQAEYEKAQMRMNEPEARALEEEVAADFGNNIMSFTPHIEPGFEPGQGGKYGWPGNWPGTPLGLGKEQDWNYTVTPGDPFDYTQKSGIPSLIGNGVNMQDILEGLRNEPGTGNIIPEGPGKDIDKVGEGSYWNVGYTPPGGGSDTFNALMGGANKQQATGATGVESVGLYQTWKRIKKQIGEAAANQWLEAQQA